MTKLYCISAYQFTSGPMSKEDARFLCYYLMSSNSFLPTMGEWNEGYEPSENWKLRLAHNLRNRIYDNEEWNYLPSEVLSKIRELYQKLWDEAMAEI